MNKDDKKFLKTFLKAAYAGISIGLACLAYIIINNKVLGSLVFALGLFIILTNNFNLFTGRLCFLKENLPSDNALDLLTIWVGNFFGMAIFILLINTTKLVEFRPIASAIMSSKTLESPLGTFVLGVFCEIMIYISVDPFKKNNISDLVKMLALIVGVFTFVLCGFEHCVANMFYFFQSSDTVLPLQVLIVSTMGNITGGLIIYGLKIIHERLSK